MQLVLSWTAQQWTEECNSPWCFLGVLPSHQVIGSRLQRSGMRYGLCSSTRDASSESALTPKWMWRGCTEDNYYLLYGFSRRTKTDGNILGSGNKHKLSQWNKIRIAFLVDKIYPMHSMTLYFNGPTGLWKWVLIWSKAKALSCISITNLRIKGHPVSLENITVFFHLW